MIENEGGDVDIEVVYRSAEAVCGADIPNATIV
jgi:hypothetical protein